MRASVTYDLARKMGQPVMIEFFADREYGDDRQIVFARKVTGESHPDEVADRVVRGVTEGKVTTVNGADIDIPSDSVCVHRDTRCGEAAEAIVRKSERMMGGTPARRGRGFLEERTWQRRPEGRCRHFYASRPESESSEEGDTRRGRTVGSSR